jgi:hypothetical protein
MWRPAASRFGAIACLAGLACWTGGGHQAPLATTLEAQPRDITGAYWCTFDEDDLESRYPCMIKKVRNRLVLAMLGGEERLRGHIALDDRDGFSFVGELYCEYDDCQQTLHGRFRPVGRGGFKGSFREEAMVLHLLPAPAGAFAAPSDEATDDPFDYQGPAFGGDTYGGLLFEGIGGRRRRP